MNIEDIWLRTDPDGRLRVLFREDGTYKYKVAIDVPHTGPGEGVISECAHPTALEEAKLDPLTQGGN